jgi:hypothetical protein
MTDPILTPEVYGPDHANANGLAAAKAAMDAVSSRHPNETFFNRLDYVRVACDASTIVHGCTAAYWVETDTTRAFHHCEAVKSLRAIADRFGFDLVERGK